MQVLVGVEMSRTMLPKKGDLVKSHSAGDAMNDAAVVGYKVTIQSDFVQTSVEREIVVKATNGMIYVLNVDGLEANGREIWSKS